MAGCQRMPRYFFHTEDGHRFPDDVGKELPTLDHVRRQAVRSFLEMLDAQVDALWTDGGLRLIVQDDSGLTLFTLEASVQASPAVPVQSRGAQPSQPPHN
jgi:hypothetical protein